MRNESGHHCGMINRVVNDEFVFDLEDRDMDGQSKTNQGGSQPKSLDRRRIAIAAALMMMGAVLIDPALLDDMNVSVQLTSDTGSDGEPMDEFAQIEFMLAQSEQRLPTGSTATPDPAVQETTEIATADVAVEPVPAGVLMIPQQAPTMPVVESSGSVASSEPTGLTIPFSVVSDTHTSEAMSVSQSVPVLTPSPATLPSHVEVNNHTTIRLTGTIDPIR